MWRALFQEGAGAFAVEMLKVCALIAPHLLAADSEAGSSGSQSPDLGDMWMCRCPVRLEWISSCSASETSFGCEEYEHNNECRAIEVIGQDWSSEVVALSLSLEDWELGNGLSLPGNEGRMLGEPRVPGFSLVNCRSKQAFLSPWTGCDSKGEGCGERK